MEKNYNPGFLNKGTFGKRYFKLVKFNKMLYLISDYAWVAELVDARDLKSLGQIGCTSSILVPGTNK